MMMMNICKNSDVLIWVENVLKNRTTFLKLKCCELAVLTLYISTNKLLVQSAVYIYQNIVK